LLHSYKFQQVYRSPGIKNLATFLSANEALYEQIFVSRKNEAAIYYLFFNRHFEAALSREFATKLQLNQFANIVFTQEECLSPEIIAQGMIKQNSLFIINAGCLERIPALFNQFPAITAGPFIYQDNGDIIFHTYHYQK